MNIFSTSARRHDYANAEFQRVVGGFQTVRNEFGVTQSVPVRALKTFIHGSDSNVIILAPMKSLAVEDFTFPFHATSKIRDALRLKVMPFSAAGAIEIFPVLLSKSGREARGIVWYVSPDELDIPSSSHHIWPAPLPFASALKDFGGCGVTFWVDEENICSILWQSFHPVLYRWKNNIDSRALSLETAWYDKFCDTRALDRGGDFVLNADSPPDNLPEIIRESIKLSSWIPDLNLSRPALEGAKDLERAVRFSARVAVCFVMAGAVILGAEILDWHRLSSEVRQTRERSEKFYRETFDPQRTGRISNPVTLARDKIASLTGKSDEGHPLDEVLADMGEIFAEKKSSNMTIDTIRYSAEGIDCTGTAPDMTTVLNFRRSWEQKANLVQLDNTQFVAGIGYRFDIRIRW